MLTIRREQVQALVEVPRAAFEYDLVEHCRGYAARLFELRGEDCIRTVVRTGIERAHGAGFDRRGPARFWIELMFAFGHDFDTDPQLVWLADALADASLPQLARAKSAFEALRSYQDEVEGHGKVHALAALRRALDADWQTLADEGAGHEASVLAAMAGIHPRKVARVGETALRRLVATAAVEAARHRIDDATGRALIAGLMFGFGHGVLRDPLYPWVASTLASPGAGRAERLANKTRTYIRAMLGHLDG